MKTSLAQSISRETLQQLHRNLEIVRESSLERLAEIHDLNETLLKRINADQAEEMSENINIQV
ncbi:MAG: hypothetical protein H8E46_10705 [FCB group bacterium]|nr:hypothetical protein [FCB group bacterium]